MNIKWLACALVITFSVNSHAETSVWKVTKGDNTVYLGGTIHLLSESDYPLPAGFDTAYKAADTLVFETDMAATGSMEFQMKFMQAMTYQDGSSFEAKLKPTTVAELRRFAQSRGMSLEPLKPFTPAGLTIMLTVMEYQRIGLDPRWGVDMMFYNRAKLEKKNIEWFESPDQQLKFLANMGEGQEDEIVLYTLKDIDQIQGYFNDMKTAWLAGDVKALATAAKMEGLKKDFPNTYTTIISGRNSNWMKTLLPLFEDDDTEFVLVGALHFSGDDGLLQQLKKRGFKIEQL